MCGSVKMVEAAVLAFLAQGLGEGFCFSDAFSLRRCGRARLSAGVANSVEVPGVGRLTPAACVVGSAANSLPLTSVRCASDSRGEHENGARSRADTALPAPFPPR